MRNQNTESVVPLLPEISARWSLLWAKFQIPVAREGGREISTPRPIVRSNCFKYKTVFLLFSPCGSWKSVWLRCIYHNCACSLAETLISRFRAIRRVLFCVPYGECCAYWHKIDAIYSFEFSTFCFYFLVRICCGFSLVPYYCNYPRSNNNQQSAKIRCSSTPEVSFN